MILRLMLVSAVLDTVRESYEWDRRSMNLNASFLKRKEFQTGTIKIDISILHLLKFRWMIGC